MTPWQAIEQYLTLAGVAVCVAEKSRQRFVPDLDQMFLKKLAQAYSDRSLFASLKQSARRSRDAAQHLINFKQVVILRLYVLGDNYIR